jgi:hypothetical protein
MFMETLFIIVQNQTPVKGPSKKETHLGTFKTEHPSTIKTYEHNR